VHSGDSACSIPPQTISADALATIREWTPRLAKALKVVGLINIQYVVQDNQARGSACTRSLCCICLLYSAHRMLIACSA
jgi:carbamoylphosphate synthase large subunit